MRAKDIILRKRRKEALSDDEIKFMVDGYTKGVIPDYQMSALTMAICFCGMTKRECAVLTEAMMRSGDTVDLSAFGSLSVDKHSTGGVGDKTSLVVLPIAASLGCYAAKMSGRGLGHTGGTIDKLESAAGFRTELEAGEFIRQVKRCKIAVIGQTKNIAPADKMLYSLRDATSTVDSVPLIASSIMSKKLAAGAANIVLDVKVGSGAFMKNIEDARLLAREMTDIGTAFSRKVRALITNMDMPLGHAVGNSLEVIEAAGVLKGDVRGDLREICTALAANMVSMARSISIEEAVRAVDNSIDSGAAFEKMKEWFSAQGADALWLENTELFPKAKVTYEIKSRHDGYISAMDTQRIGNAASLLGAGRLKKDDPIDFSAGIIVGAKTGEPVRTGDTLAVLYTSDADSLAAAEDEYLCALSFSEERPRRKDLICDIVGR